MPNLISSAFGLLLGLGFAAASAAELSFVCSNGDFRIHGGGTGDAEAVCEASIRAKDFLTHCGLLQITPINIGIVQEMSDDLGGAYLAVCHPNSGQIEILARAAFREHLIEGQPLAALPAEDVYDSLIAHELAHAFFFQTTGGIPHCRAANEYVASAMQIALLPTASRETLLSEFKPVSDTGLERFNEFMLAADPIRFSVNAYRHFIRPENGCAFIKRVVSGDVIFPEEQN